MDNCCVALAFLVKVDAADFKVARGRGDGTDDIADRAFEFVGECAHHCLAFGEPAVGLLLPLGFQLFESHQIVAESARRARSVANFVATLGKGNDDVAVSVRQLQQDTGNGVNGTPDRQNAESGCTHEDDDDEKSEADADLPRFGGARRGFSHALRRELAGGRGGFLDQQVDLFADLARPRQRQSDFGIGLFRRHHRCGCRGVVMG